MAYEEFFTAAHLAAQVLFFIFCKDIYWREKSFGQRLKFGLLGGNLCLWGPERFFSVVRNADCTNAFPGRAEFIDGKEQ
jgi:hypothetical protein